MFDTWSFIVERKGGELTDLSGFYVFYQGGISRCLGLQGAERRMISFLIPANCGGQTRRVCLCFCLLKTGEINVRNTL